VRRDTAIIQPGAVLDVGDKTLCIRSWSSAERVLVQDLTGGQELTMDLNELTRLLGEAQTHSAPDLSTIEDDEWEELLERYNLLRPLLNNPDRTLASVKEVAKELLVSHATVYRWIKRLEEFGTITRLRRRSRNDKGRKRVNPEVEAIITRVIEEEFLTTLKRSPTKAREEIGRRCRTLGYSKPSLTTVLDRIMIIHPYERTAKREGRNKAQQYRAQKGSLPGADYVNAFWQIDHTFVDIMLVDDIDRIEIGHPWITLVIDVFPRTVPG